MARHLTVRTFLCLGFYDGAVSGVAELNDGRKVGLELLAWDSRQDRRIFCGFPVTEEEFQSLVQQTELKETGKMVWGVVPYGAEWHGDFKRKEASFLLRTDGYFNMTLSEARLSDQHRRQLPKLPNYDSSSYARWAKLFRRRQKAV